MQEIELTIEGMTCHHCVMSVQKELSKLSGVEVKDVQIGRARVRYDEAHVRTEDLERAIEEAGYRLVR